MTAPARVPSTGTRGRSTTLPERERSAERSRTAAEAARRRGAAAQRAEARRAQRLGPARREAAQRVAAAGSRTPFVLLIMGLLAAGIVSTLWLSTTATADSYQLEQIRATNKALSEHEEELRHQVAAQDSPGSLIAAARSRGMVPSGDPARLLVKPDGSVVVVAEAKPAVVPAVPPASSQPAQPAEPQPQQSQPAQPQPAQPNSPQGGQNPPAQPTPNPAQQADGASPGPAPQAAPVPPSGGQR